MDIARTPCQDYTSNPSRSRLPRFPRRCTSPTIPRNKHGIHVRIITLSGIPTTYARSPYNFTPSVASTNTPHSTSTIARPNPKETMPATECSTRAHRLVLGQKKAEGGPIAEHNARTNQNYNGRPRLPKRRLTLQFEQSSGTFRYCQQRSAKNRHKKPGPRVAKRRQNSTACPCFRASPKTAGPASKTRPKWR